jgi:hypothetical protein
VRHRLALGGCQSFEDVHCFLLPLRSRGGVL